MQKESTSRSIWMYLFITFGLSILLSVTIGFSGGHTGKFINLRFFSMLIPAIGIFVLQIMSVPFPYDGWTNFSQKWFVLALFIFPVIIHSVCLPVIASQNNFHLPWQSWLSAGDDGLFHTPADKNWGVLTTSGLIFHILLNAVTGLIAVSIFAFFEEIGWRAWLLPKLIERFTIKKGILAGAVIWALWHIPFILGGVIYIENAPLQMVVLFYPLGYIGIGIIIGWIWIRTNSIWIVSLAHGSLNNWGQYAFKYMNSTSSPTENTALVAALNLSLLVAGVIVLLLMKDLKIRNKE